MKTKRRDEASDRGTRKPRPTRVKTPKFRAAFVTLFEPRGMDDDPDGKKSYSVTMLFDKNADLSEMKKAVEAAIQKKWGNKRPANLRLPFRDAGEKAGEYEGFKKGMTFVTARTYDKPQVVDQDVNPITDRKELYSGCYAWATVVAGAYEARGNKGVAFYLNNVQKLADGEPLGGTSRAEDDFKPVDSDDDEDEDDEDLDDEDEDLDEEDEDEEDEEDEDDEDEDEDPPPRRRRRR